VQQCVKNAERGPPVHDGEKQKIENDSLKKECDCLRKVTGSLSWEPYFFFSCFPLNHTGHKNKIEDFCICR